MYAVLSLVTDKKTRRYTFMGGKRFPLNQAKVIKRLA